MGGGVYRIPAHQGRAWVCGAKTTISAKVQGFVQPAIPRKFYASRTRLPSGDDGAANRRGFESLSGGLADVTAEDLARAHERLINTNRAPSPTP